MNRFLLICAFTGTAFGQSVVTAPTLKIIVSVPA